jgi:hypothetical protein
MNPLDLTDEEWIAASQACCGIEHDEQSQPLTRPDGHPLPADRGEGVVPIPATPVDEPAGSH